MRISSSSTVVLLVLTILLLPGVARAQLSVIDQQSAIEPGQNTFAIGGASEQILAQVVTTGITGPLVGINVPVAGMGDLIVEIQGVTGVGEPDGSIFLSQTFPAPGSGSDTFVSLMFSTPMSFSVGDEFAIVLSSTGTLGMSRAPTGDTYMGGSAFFDSRPNTPGVWVALSIGGNPDDLAFQTVVSISPGMCRSNCADTRRTSVASCLAAGGSHRICNRDAVASLRSCLASCAGP